MNTKCNGFGCEYEGPSIIINEVMIHPSSGDGSIFGQGGLTPQAGEWIELYNPDLCKPIDISCYFLGNNSPDGISGNWYGGGFELPQGTIVPARGFCIVRGVNAPAVPSNLLVQNGGNTVEVVVSPGPGVCIGGGSRLWFPNAGGWFAFYDNFGVPQDAISWNNNNSGSGTPCNPVGNCPFTGVLPSYDNIPLNRKNYIYPASPPTGLSIRRLPDGGTWISTAGGAATYGTCNAACAPAPLITCNGQAGVSVSGGTPPYTYVWNDGQAQVNAIALGLCDGTYCVTVIDSDGSSSIACVLVQNYIPTVTAAPSLPDMCMYEPPVSLISGTPVGGTYTGSGVSGSQFDPFVAGPGSHMIKYAWYNADSCYNEAITTVSVYAAPQISLDPFPGICIDDLPLSLNNGLPAGGTYSGPGVNGMIFDPSITGAGSFLISYSYADPSGCSADTSALITVGPLPEAFVLSGGGSTCPGADPLSVYLSGSEPGVSYLLLQNGQATSLGVLGTGQALVFFPLQDSGIYTVQAVNMTTGCKSFMNGSAAIFRLHMPVIEIGDTLHFCDAAGIQLDAGDFADSLAYEWFNGSTERFFSVTEPGTYWVKVTKGQCYDEDSVLVEACSELWMPNIFTPNGDAFNQRFLPKILAGEILEYSIDIFNRWGKMVYNSGDISEGWDGSLFNRGNDCPDGVYFYVVRYTGAGYPYPNVQGRLSGQVTLMR